MKIVYATYPWAFETPGGGEQQILQYEHTLTSKGYEIERHDPWTNNLSTANLVHFFSCVGGSEHFCNYVRDRRIPLVISTSLWLTEASLNLYPIEQIKKQLKLANVIVTNGDIESERIRTLLNLSKSKFVTVRNGFDPIFARYEDPELFRSAFGIKGPFLLNVANIEPRKNQLSLIRAAKAIGIPLVLIGHVRDQVYAESCFSERGSGLHYIGPLDHYSPLLRSAYRACSVFCLPSTLETPGLAALEAAAAGATLVITSQGSTREYFSDLAYYVDPQDEYDILQKITAALQSKTCNKLSRHVTEHFEWHNTVSTLASLYDSLVYAGET